MGSLDVALSSTMRPWRSLYAFSCCCCLLPLSAALRPSVTAASRLAAGAARTAARSSNHHRSSSSLSHPATAAGGAVASAAPASARSMSSWKAASTAGRSPRRTVLHSSGGGGGGGCAITSASPWVGGGSSGCRAFSGGKRPKIRGRGWKGRRVAGGDERRAGVPLGMGKGSDRKKAKKEQAAANRASGKKVAAASVVALNKQSAAAAAASQVVVQEVQDKEGFLSVLELFRKAKAPKRIFQAFETAKRKDVDGLPDLAAAAVKEELKLSRADLATRIIESLGVEQWDTWLASDLDGAQSVVRCACAASEPAFAEELIAKAGFSCRDVGGGCEAREEYGAAAASVYPNLVTAYSRKGRRDDAMRLMEAMAGARVPVKTAAANRLLQGFHKRRDLEAVFKVLDVMAASGAEGDDETYEWLANAAVRSVDFVTGAVSMATLPKEPVLPEAAFIGRSNVGKSSLINMVCNRKALAYTSKRPGKTQQFNYFMMNKNTENAFYLVDMPGMGYARVPEKQRNEWSKLFRSYITRRSSLRVLFHLIDGRHGPVGQDHTIMRLMAELPDTARYVVALTKADKSDNTVSRQVLEGVVSALREAGVSRTPVVLTSAASKLGRDGMWRYLRLAALDKSMRDQHLTDKPRTPDKEGDGSARDKSSWTRVARQETNHDAQEQDAPAAPAGVTVPAGVQGR